MEGVVGMVCAGHLNDKKEEGLVFSEGVRGKRSVQTNPLSELPQTGNPSNERRQVDVAAVPKILSSQSSLRSREGEEKRTKAS